jgi:hypothetical protein
MLMRRTNTSASIRHCSKPFGPAIENPVGPSARCLKYYHYVDGLFQRFDIIRKISWRVEFEAAILAINLPTLSRSGGNAGAWDIHDDDRFDDDGCHDARRNLRVLPADIPGRAAQS